MGIPRLPSSQSTAIKAEELPASQQMKPGNFPELGDEKVQLSGMPCPAPLAWSHATMTVMQADQEQGTKGIRGRISSHTRSHGPLEECPFPLALPGGQNSSESVQRRLCCRCCFNLHKDTMSSSKGFCLGLREFCTC